MNKIFLFILFVIIAGLSHAGEISGHVYFEKNSEKKPLANSTVRLHVYRDDYEFSGAEVKTNASGVFTFPDLNSGKRYAYILYPIYDGINYPYQEVHIEKTADKVKRDFVVQESTGSTKDLSVNESIYFEIGQKDIWKVRHEITIENKGNQFYHPDAPNAEAIRFALFSGGFDLAILDGISRDNSKIDDQDDILEVYLTLAPHQSSTMKFSYYYLPESHHMIFERPAFLARSNVNLFFKSNIHIFSSEFKFDPMLSKTDPQYKYAFSSGAISRDAKIQFDIRGFYMQRDYLRGLVLLACLSLLIGITYFVIRQSRQSSDRKNEVIGHVYQYLTDLRTRLSKGEISEKEFKKENDRALNFLYYNSKNP